jgi:stage II sporulation protein B
MSQDRNRITIRINGKDKHIDDQTPSNNQTSSTEEIAATHDREERQNEQPFQWELPKEIGGQDNVVDFEALRRGRSENGRIRKNGEQNSVGYTRPTLPLHRKHKQKQKPMKGNNNRSFRPSISIPPKLVAAIVSALVIGVGFGLVLLMLFTDDRLSDQPSKPVEAPPSRNESSPTTSTVTADLSLTAGVVQGGVFSSQETSGTIASSFKDDGYAAVVEESADQFYILIGIAQSEAAADLIEESYIEDGYEAFAKEWTISSEEMTVPEQVDQKVLVAGKEILEAFLAYSSNNEDRKADLRESFQRWETASQSIQQWPEKSQPISHEYANLVSKAFERITQSDDNWEIQQAILECFVGYEKVINHFK